MLIQIGHIAIFMICKWSMKYYYFNSEISISPPSRFSSGYHHDISMLNSSPHEGMITLSDKLYVCYRYSACWEYSHALFHW